MLFLYGAVVVRSYLDNYTVSLRENNKKICLFTELADLNDFSPSDDFLNIPAAKQARSKSVDHEGVSLTMNKPICSKCGHQVNGYVPHDK